MGSGEQRKDQIFTRVDARDFESAVTSPVVFLAVRNVGGDSFFELSTESGSHYVVIVYSSAIPAHAAQDAAMDEGLVVTGEIEGAQ